MKKIISALSIILLVLLFIFRSPIAGAATPLCYPFQGCTGTSTVPTYGQILVGNSVGTYTLTATSSLGISSGAGTIGSGILGQVPYYAAAGTTLTATSSLFIDATGNIGIGNTAPIFPLQVTKSSSGVITADIQNTNGSTNSGTQLFLGTRGTIGDITTGVAVLASRTDAGGNFGSTDLLLKNSKGNTLSTNIIVKDTGLVGIGATTTPWGLLSVNPTATDSGLTGAFTGPQFVIGSSTATSFIVANNSNAGVGTTTPGSLLSIGNTGGINFSLATSSFSTTGGIDLKNGCFSIGGTCIGASGASLTGTTGQTAYFSGTNTAVGTSTLFIGTNSTVGIGTTSPSVLLDVQMNGNSAPILGSFRNYSSGTAAGAQISVVNDVNAQFSLSSLSSGSTLTQSAYGGTSALANAGRFRSSSAATGGMFLGTGAAAPLVFFTQDNEAMRILSGGSTGGFVGIGTTTPFAELSVNTVAGSAAFAIGSSTGTQFIVDKNGNVGIGTVTPVAQLQLNTLAGTDAFKIGSTTTQFIVDKSGNVGIGTTSPGNTLVVQKDANIYTDVIQMINASTGTGAQTRIRFDNNATVGLAAGSATSIFYTGGNYTGYPANAFGFWNSQNGPIGFATNNTERLRLQASGGLSLGDSTYVAADPGAGSMIIKGNVGMGTTTPWAQFSINPNGVGGPEFAVGSSTSTHLVIDSAGNIGIGNASPTIPFQMTKNVAGVLRFDVQNINSSTNADVELFLGTRGTVGDVTTGASIYADRTDLASNFGSTDLIFKNSLGNTLNTNVTIKDTGEVGIGTTTPMAWLSVVNNSFVNTGSGTFTAKNLFAVASSTVNASAAVPVYVIDANGHIITGGKKPVCDANCTFKQGNDNAFRVTLGSSVTSSTVTFGNTWGANAPICTANEGDAGTVDVNASSTPTTVVLTSLTALTTKDVEVRCIGIQ